MRHRNKDLGVQPVAVVVEDMPHQRERRNYSWLKTSISDVKEGTDFIHEQISAQPGPYVGRGHAVAQFGPE